MNLEQISEFNNNEKHNYFMQLAFEQALLAQTKGEIPVGAIVVDDDENIIGMGYNQTITNNDPSAHAEIIALRQAASYRSNYRLPNTSLYVTLEPCMMCLGAMFHARVQNIIFGASDKKTGMCGGLLSLHEHASINHHATVISGVLQEKCSRLLVEFFKERRKKL